MGWGEAWILQGPGLLSNLQQLIFCVTVTGPQSVRCLIEHPFWAHVSRTDQYLHGGLRKPLVIV
jgi:hypothetical protein